MRGKGAGIRPKNSLNGIKQPFFSWQKQAFKKIITIQLATSRYSMIFAKPN
jgi:hypothetical protein